METSRIYRSDKMGNPSILYKVVRCNDAPCNLSTWLRQEGLQAPGQGELHKESFSTPLHPPTLSKKNWVWPRELLQALIPRE